MASLVTLHSQVAHLHHGDLLRQAERDRLLRAARGGTPSLLDRVRLMLARRQADAGSKASARRTYAVAPIDQ